MNERDYLAARKKFEEEYQDRIRSLDTVWRALNGSTPPKVPRNSVKRKTTRDEKPSKLVTAIEFVLPELPDEFNTLDVIHALQKVWAAGSQEPLSRTAVTHTLKRMATGRLFAITKPGKGQSPTKYAKTQESESTVTE